MTRTDDRAVSSLPSNHRRIGLLLLLLLCSFSSYAQTLYPFDLPAQPLADSLRAVGRQTSTNVLFEPRLVKDLRAPALRTQATVPQAIRLLLEGTPLNAVQVDPDSILIERAALEGGQAAQHIIRLEEIVVTGTHLRGVASESSPVLVLTRREIEASGYTTVEQLIRSVPQNYSAGANQETFNVNFGGADLTEQGAGVNLRGLGQRATLVLVNGYRLAPSGVNGSNVDISLIPITAIERIEVLTNGASAIYGSDAVGGVMNFILRKDFSGLETSLHLGTATEGDGDQLTLAQAGGWNWDSGHALMTYEYRSEDAVLAGDRDFTVAIPPASFFLPRERRHSFYGTFDQQLAERVAVDLSGSYSTRDTQRDYFPSGTPRLVSADADSDVYSLNGSLTYTLPNLWRAQLSGSFSKNESRSSLFENEGADLINDGEWVNELGEVTAKLDGDVYNLPGGAIKLAIGLQYRREGHDSTLITEGHLAAGSPATVQSTDRSSRAAFAEILVPVVSSANRFAGVEQLEFSAAARHERYAQFGDTTDPKFGMIWTPVRGLSLRGTYGTSFRAPLLTEAQGIYNAFYVPNGAFYYASPDDPLVGDGVALLVLGTNRDISSETSRTWTAGIVVEPEPLPGLTLTMDYFSTKFSDRIALPAPDVFGIVGDPAFSSVVHTRPPVAVVNGLIDGATEVRDFTGPGFSSGGSVPADVTLILDDRFANTAVTVTRGMDLGLAYDFVIGRHDLGLHANMTYLTAFDNRLTRSSPADDALDQPYSPISLRANAALSWAYAGWGANLVMNYVDSYEDARFTPSRPIDSFEYFDLYLSYRFDSTGPALLQGTRFALSVLNLLDSAPPKLSPDPGHVRGVGYDPVNASGRGRFVAIQVQKLWGGAAASRK